MGRWTAARLAAAEALATEQKPCRACGRTLALAEFYPCASNLAGCTSLCKVSYRARVADRRATYDEDLAKLTDARLALRRRADEARTTPELVVGFLAWYFTLSAMRAGGTR